MLVWAAMPLGLLQLASALEQAGHTVKIADMGAYRLSDADLISIIQKENPKYVGITATTSVIKKAIALARLVKQIDASIKVIIGGAHATYLPEEVISDEAVDFLVLGEGELTLCELIDCLSKEPDKIGQVKGICYKNDDQVIFTEKRELIKDLDTLPFSAWHLIDLGLYYHPLCRSRRFATIVTSRGCPSRCTFCSRGVFLNHYRARSAKSVLAEIEMLVLRFAVKEIHFIDDNFSLGRRHVEEICQGIIAKGWKIKWAAPNGVRADTIDEDLLKLMKQSGCYSLSFGVESGNQKTLDYIKKGITVNNIREAFRLCHKYGIETVAFIIIGLPNEDKKDINQTLRFLKEIKADIVDAHILIPLPGTELYRELDSKGYIIEKDWDKYVFNGFPVYKTDHLSPLEIDDEFRRIRLQYHLRPSYILSRLAQIRSWREVRNNFKGLLALLKQKS